MQVVGDQMKNTENRRGWTQKTHCGNPNQELTNEGKFDMWTLSFFSLGTVIGGSNIRKVREAAGKSGAGRGRLIQKFPVDVD